MPNFSVKDSPSLKIFISFSMGKSSAEMCALILKHFPLAQKVFMTANTGEEAEASLVFGNLCDQYFKLGLIWVEAVVHHGERRGSTHRVVTFKTASRDGEPYESVIQKYGLANVEYLHCTRELKTNPMYSYIASLGWKKGEYIVALGIRADEPKRINEKARELGIWYPLYEAEIDKADVNDAWAKRPFNLEIEEFEGNCKWCFKKSDKKHIANILKNPKWYEFPFEMEFFYSDIKADKDHLPRKIFRRERTTEQMLKLAGYFKDDNSKRPNYPDEDSGCSESCEVEIE